MPSWIDSQARRGIMANVQKNRYRGPDLNCEGAITVSRQSLFIFQYYRRGQTSLWDKGDGRVERIEPQEVRRDRTVRFERLGDRLVRVFVLDPEAFDPTRNQGVDNDSVELADEEFRRNLPDQFLAGPH
jgi:hypothetical protein